MKRDAWEFEHTATKLADAAEAKKRHHVARLEWWEGKKAEVMVQIRAKGISVHESVAATAGAYSSAPRGASARIMVDATLQRDLDECTEKVGDHRRKAELYDGWVQVLRGNPEARVKLHHDDFLFFFGATNSVEIEKDEDEEEDLDDI